MSDKPSSGAPSPNPSQNLLRADQGKVTLAKAETQQARTGETVTVACKLPNGMVMRTYTFREKSFQNQNGDWRTEMVAHPDPEEYYLNGFAINPAEFMNGEMPRQIAGGFGLTTGIPKEFWEKWHKQNEPTDLVKNSLVFSYSSLEGARAQAKEKMGIKSGLEPFDPDKPPAFLRRIKRFSPTDNGRV
jgi:hypothetical protein